MKYLLAAGVCILLLLSACDISKPRIPTWDVDLTVPLMNERYLISELADSLNIQIGENDVLTITGTGAAETPPFGHVNFIPDAHVDDIALISGTNFQISLPITDPSGKVFLTYAKIVQGTLQYILNITNPGNTAVTLQIPTVCEPDGTPLEIVYNGSSSWQGRSLEDCWIGEHNSSDAMEFLEIHFTVTSDQPDGTQVGTGSLKIDTQVGFSEFEGYLYDYERALSGTATSINIDYPYNLEEAVQLQEAHVYVQITNEIGFAAALHGELYAKNNRTGVERVIPIVDEDGIPFEVEAATSAGAVITSFNFSSNVQELLQIMPDVIELRNSHLLFNAGHDQEPGFVRETEKVYATYQVDAPFIMIIYNHLIEMPDVIEVDMAEDSHDEIMDNILGAELTFGITNKIPVGGTATVYFSTSPEVTFADANSYDFIKSVNVHSSQYTGPGVDQFGEQVLHLSLSQQEIQTFTNSVVYIIWSFAFEASDGPVTITASPADYIQVKCMLSVGYHVELES